MGILQKFGFSTKPAEVRIQYIAAPARLSVDRMTQRLERITAQIQRIEKRVDAGEKTLKEKLLRLRAEQDFLKSELE